jgi:hypothetical protein
MAANSPDGPVLNQKHTFIRSYQACVPCRKRKVKCDLGDPGNPCDPPCLRCRREHKDCYFQDLRTSKNSSSAKGDAGPPAKRARIEGVAESSPASLHSATGQLNSFGDIFAVAKSSVTRRAAVLSPNESATADRILHKEVHNAKEALNLLYEAAAESRSESDDGHGAHPKSDARANTDDINTVAWRDFWCVKAGWMTEGEARHYIDLYPLYYKDSRCSFFDNLNPLAPLISRSLKDDQHILATSEHALANTILTISARYHTLSGIGGASRSYAIHDRLWRYTRGLLSKLPFSGSQTVRKYGMVESLLLLTEWHPRNFHFPDDDAEEERRVASGIYSFDRN